MMNSVIKRVLAGLLTIYMLFSVMPATFAMGGGEDNITITFRIDNPDYTYDPGSGHTHLTVSNNNLPPEAEVTASEKWGNKYKVAGKGVLAVYTIPRGTSISGNDKFLPQLEVTNASWLQNRYSYISLKSWVTSSGRVCSDDTVFYEDTVLSLSLYESNDSYSIDFVCCEEHQPSANYYCRHSGNMFKLGQSLSEDHFITKEELLKDFPTNNHTFDNFAGWQLKDNTTGQYVPLTPDTPLTENYIYPYSQSSTIKAYASWEEPNVSVTASFMNGSITVDTRSLNIGDALGDLPDMSSLIPEGYTFLGWQYTDESGNSAYADASTVISADTVYTAVFSEIAVGDLTVTFHDILPNGTEASDPITVPLSSGSSLTAAGDTFLSDGKSISECIWHVNGSSEAVDISTYTVTNNIDLYTYQYQVVLTYRPPALPKAKARSVDVTHGAGGSLTITITAREGEPLSPFDFIIEGVDYSTYDWYREDNGEQLDISALIVGGLTGTITAASDPPGPQITITYNMNITPTPVAPHEYNAPTIMGSDTTASLTTNATSHIVLAPSLTSYFYPAGNFPAGNTKYLGKATFKGWAVNGNTSNIVQPDSVLDLSPYSGSGTVTLTAQWETKSTHYTSNNPSTSNGPMVNFFVSIYARPIGTSAWTGSIETANFTKSVYTDDCGVSGRLVVPRELYESLSQTSWSRQYFILGGTSGTNINESHNTIVNSLTDGYTKHGNNNTDYKFQLTFPTDEYVMQRVRQDILGGRNITINGHNITVDEMTAENFTVRWYVFKYDSSDGYHIDGVLVSKEDTIRVTKTFAGDAEAIEAVKSGYYISVEPQSGQTGMANTGGTLRLSGTPSNGVYIAHVEGSNTYTWDIPVDQFYRYTVKENSYTYTDNNTTTNAQYMVSNSKVSNENTGGWVNYTGGNVKVTGQVTPDGASPLTVDFLNTYVKPGMLTLHKVDSVTGHGLEGLTFDVTDSSDTPITLYGTPDRHYYTDDSHGGTVTSTVTTNSNGQFFITLDAGVYKLIEHVPEGYQDPGVITVRLEVVDGHVVITSAEAGTDDVVDFVDNTLTLSLRNHSEKTDLKVKKIWADGTAQKPVTIQLYCNNVAYGAPISFDGTVDSTETVPWEHIYSDVPLYVDGALANYTIRETKIDTFNYSGEYSDGYQYYTLVYPQLIYRDSMGNITTDIASAVSAELSVTNSRNTGTLQILKVDEDGNALQGATFRLYNVDSSGSGAPVYTVADLLKSAGSDTNGIVDFGTVNDGQYYLVEYSAPAGYESSDAVFRLKTLNGVITMEQWDDDAGEWIPVSDNRVVNRLAKTDVTIQKKVDGKIGDFTKEFQFSVSSTKPMESGTGYTLSSDGKTAEFELSHMESVELKGVPIGAVLTITESNADGYVKTITVGGSTATGGITVVSDMDTIIVTNTKDITPDTGILLDSWPYILILSGVAAAAVFLFIRNRKNRKRDDD